MQLGDEHPEAETVTRRIAIWLAAACLVGFGWLERLDILAAVQYLRGRLPGQPMADPLAPACAAALAPACEAALASASALGW